jgi:hypothetical protein
MSDTGIVNFFEGIISATYEINKHESAEMAFAMARISLQLGDYPAAKMFATKSIAILENLKIDTIERAASERIEFLGVQIPELLHEGIVRERFSDILG